MMEDWTDIMGEELQKMEEPLPADDWSVLQQKYAASQRRKKAAAFAWAGGISSVAAAIILVFLLVRPDSTITESVLVAEILPPTEEIVPVGTGNVESPINTAIHVVPSAQKKGTVPMSRQKKVSVPVDAAKKRVDDELVAENNTEQNSSDTTSLKSMLIAEAATYAHPTGTYGFDDFPEEEPRRKRRPMSIGMSGSVSGTPVIGMMDMAAPGLPPNLGTPEDTTVVETYALMTRGGRNYNETYNHEIPISFGVSVRYCLADRLSVNTGLNYTRYTSVRNRYYYTGEVVRDKQYAHYLVIQVRLDLMAVNRKHFNFYIGAGVQADKCIYAIVGNERLREKAVLFGLNGALGFQVNIVPMVGLYFEPEVSYALNEGSLQIFRSKEPLMISARAGLRFNF